MSVIGDCKQVRRYPSVHGAHSCRISPKWDVRGAISFVCSLMAISSDALGGPEMLLDRARRDGIDHAIASYPGHTAVGAYFGYCSAQTYSVGAVLVNGI